MNKIAMDSHIAGELVGVCLIRGNVRVYVVVNENLFKLNLISS